MSNQTVTVMCLQQSIQSGPLHYPLFVGFVPVQQVAQIAEAPSFDEKNTKNKDIADNILHEPIRDWQRPINIDRVQDIADIFSQQGEFMPNPVLLAENVVDSPARPTIEMQTGAGTTVYKVSIPIPASGDPKPLWILDGQHRIAGLSKSAHPDNPIPVVLLLDQSSGNYTGRVLAKIFAQVTTEATKLHPLHNEWLTYAFNLDKYSSDKNQHASDFKQSMDCVAKLCRKQNVGPNNIHPNAFFNQVKFSYAQPAEPIPGGFYYDCVNLSENIAKYYYLKGDGADLAPDDLSEQIALAHRALTQVVPQPQNETVFFGKDSHYQKIMADAFLAGVLEFVRKRGRPTDWQSVLRSLKFDQTDWNFSRWCRTLGGQVQTTSKNMAEAILMDIFRNESLPTGTDNLADYLQGDQAKIEVACSPVNPKTGRALKTDVQRIELSNGQKLTRNVAPRSHVVICSKTSNIGRILIFDKQKRGHETRYKELQGRGLVLNTTDHTNPLELEIELHHYGGTMSTAELRLIWI